MIGSGDQKGEFKIWNHEHPKFNVAFENKILNDHIRDMAFTDDGKRGAAVGEGVIKYFYFILNLLVSAPPSISS